MSFNFMAAVSIWGDFGASNNKVSHCFHFSPYLCHEVMTPEFIFLVLSQLFHSPLSLSSRGSLVFLCVLL